MRVSPGSRGLLPWFAPMLRRDVGIKPIAYGLQVRLFEVPLQQPPHARLEAAVAGLAVPLPQAGEDAEDSRVALRRECPVSPLQLLSGAGRLQVAVDHRPLHRR